MKPWEEFGAGAETAEPKPWEQFQQPAKSGPWDEFKAEPTAPVEATSATGAFGAAALRNVIPAAAGLAGGAGTGALIGMFGGPLAPVTVPLGAAIGGALTGMVARKLQDAIVPLSESEKQMAAEHPTATAFGDLAGLALTMRPSLKSIGAAARGVGELARAGKAAGDVVRASANARAAVEAAIGTGVNVGTGVALRAATGQETTAKDVLWDAGVGALFNTPTGAGRAIVRGAEAPFAPAAPLGPQELVKWSARTHPGREVSTPRPDAARVMMLDGNEIEVRLQPEISFADADAPEFMRTMRAQFPKEAEAATVAAGGDEVAAAKELQKTFAPQGRQRQETLIQGDDGKPVRVRAILDLLAGDATRGTLAEEEFHALVKLAGADAETIKRLGKSDDVGQAEENMAAMLKTAGDNEAKGFVRRFADRLFGRDQVDAAVLEYRDALRGQVQGREAASNVSKAWNERRAQIEAIVGRPMKAATPEEFDRVSKLKQTDLFAAQPSKPAELADTATPAQRKFSEIFWNKNTTVADREAMMRAKAMGVADDLLEQFPIRSEGLTAEESARLVKFNEVAQQGRFDMAGAPIPEPMQGRERVVGSKFQQQQPAPTVFPTGAAKGFAAGEQQSFTGQDAPAPNALPVFDRGWSGKEQGRLWRKLKFADPVDDLSFQLARAAGDPKKKDNERTKYLRGALGKALGMTPEQLDGHLAETRKAVADWTLAQPEGVEAATVPKMKVRSVQERAAAQQAEAQRLAEIETAKQQAEAQRQAEIETARQQADAKRLAEIEAADAARAQRKAEVEAQREGNAAQRAAQEAERVRAMESIRQQRRAEEDALLAREDWKQEFARSADELKAGGGFGVGSYVTKADAAALRAAAAGKVLTDAQRESVLHFVKTVGEPRPRAEISNLKSQIADAEVPVTGTDEGQNFQQVETPDIFSQPPEVVDGWDAVEPPPLASEPPRAVHLLTPDQYIREHLENGEYAEEYRQEPVLAEEKRKDLLREYLREIETHLASDGKLSVEIADAIHAKIGDEAAHQLLRAAVASGRIGTGDYAPPSARDSNLSYRGFLNRLNKDGVRPRNVAAAYKDMMQDAANRQFPLNADGVADSGVNLPSGYVREGAFYVFKAGGAMPDASLPFSVSRRKQTETPEFKKWFGNSKVVDASGEPVVVYHGTPDGRFLKTTGIFQTLKQRFAHLMPVESRNSADADAAFFFAKDRATAASYADDRRAYDYQNAEPEVIQTFVKIENPKIIDWGGKRWRGGEMSKLQPISEAKEQGYDGIIVRNVIDDYQVQGNKATTVYVAFTSNQIKSATGNRGTFDANNPDIRFSVSRRKSLTDSPEVRAARESEIWRQIQLAPEKEQQWRAEGAARVATPDEMAKVMERMSKGRIAYGDGAEAVALDLAMKQYGLSGDAQKIEQMQRALAFFDRNQTLAGLQLRASQTDRFGRETPESRKQRLTRMVLKPGRKATDLIASNDPAKQAEGQRIAREEYERRIADLKEMGALVPVGGESAADGAQNFVETQGGGRVAPVVPADGGGRPGQETPAQGIQSARDTANAADRPPETAPVQEFDFRPEIVRDPQLAATVLNRIGQDSADWADIVNEVVRNNYLGNPKGQIRNGLGSAVTVGKRMTAEWAVQSLMNGARRAFGKAPDPNSVEWRNVRHAYEEILPIVGRAGRNLVKAWSTEVSGYADSFLDNGANTAIKGKLGKVVRYRQRANLAVDEFFMTIATELGIRERAMRFARVEGEANGWTDGQIAARAEAIALNPPEPIKARALDEARELTLKSDPGGFANALLRVKQGHDHNPAARVAMNLLFPFVKTPVNALKIGLKGTPIGLLRMGVKGLQGKYKGPDSQFAKDAAEQVVGLAMTSAIFGLMMPDDEGRPRITGSAASFNDSGRRDFQGNLIPPRSVRVGDKWYSYAGLEPLATSLQIAADALEVGLNAKNYGGWGEAWNKFWALSTSVLKDRTYLQQVDSLMRAIDGDLPAEELMGRLVTGAVVPGEVRAVATAADPAMRQRWNEGGGPAEGVSFGRKLDYMVFPSAGNAAPVRLDMWGNPRAKDETSVFKTGMGDTLFRLINPVDVREAKTPNNYERMLWNYYRNRPTERMPGQPDDTFRWEGAKYRMTPEEYQNFARVRGAIIQQRAARQRWNFDHPSAGDDIARFRRIIDGASDDARDMVIRMRLKTDPDAMLRERRRQEALLGVRV